MIEQLIQRLQAASTDYDDIDHAWDLDVIEHIGDRLPAAYFMPGPTDSEASQQLPVRQRISDQVVVVTVCDWAALDGLRKALYGALMGYQHAPEYTELEHVKGDVLAIKGRLVWWRDTFAADYYIGQAS